MMVNRRKIMRSITFSACLGKRVNEAGEFENYSCVLTGEYTPERATRTLRRLESDQSITIVNVDYDTKKYVMDIEDFVKHATELEN